MSVPRNDIQELDIATNHTMAANFTSFEHDLTYFDMGSVQIIWAGADSASGTFTPQASLDQVNWCDLATGTTVKKISVGSGCCMYIFSNIEFSWFRMSFTANSNTTGTVTIKTLMKRRRHV
jgi:hypothetical protein